METPQERPPGGLAAVRPPRLPRRHRARAHLALLGQGGLERARRVARPIEKRCPSSIFPGWRIYTVAATMPRFDPATWRLRIDGLVDRPLDADVRRAARLPRAEQVSDFHCVTGWSVDDVHWGGVRFRDLLAAARPQADGHACSQFVSAEQPVRRHADAASRRRSRRDARLRDGRQAAARASTARRSAS